MPIHSNSSKKDVFEYCSDWLIHIEDTRLWDHAAGKINQSHPRAGIVQYYSGTFSKLRIPNFQRGIGWEFETLLECITSLSPTQGIAVIGRTTQIPDVDFILDGLQRFATFTYLLQRLDPLFFVAATAATPNPWDIHPSLTTISAISHIQAVAAPAIGRRQRFTYNHEALTLLSRRVVSQTYENWSKKADRQLDRLLNPKNSEFKVDESQDFLEALARFVSKPIFIQELSNFSTMSELVATFVGLNTIRVELTPADVCRSLIVDGMINAQATPQDVLQIDNDFDTTLLTPTGLVKRGLDPLVKVLEYDWLQSQKHSLITAIFQSPPVAQQIKTEFNAFIAWANFWEGYVSTNTYLDFISEIGDNPYVAALLFYFHKHKAKNALNQPPSDNDLHRIAIAYVRKLLDGSVGDTLPITKLAGADQFATLDDFLMRVNPSRAGALNSKVPRPWLVSALNGIGGTSAARVIFNACLLPEIRNGAALGAAFNPLQFGRGANNWQIDHMIPVNSFVPPQSVGDAYRDSLRNFCPILGSDNTSYKATACAQKSDLGAAYLATYRSDAKKKPGAKVHPYIDALLNKQGIQGGNSELNVRELLIDKSPSTNRCYGQERIDLLADLLSERL